MRPTVILPVPFEVQVVCIRCLSYQTVVSFEIALPLRYWPRYCVRALNALHAANLGAPYGRENVRS
jgi:hypothetical protein